MKTRYIKQTPAELLLNIIVAAGICTVGIVLFMQLLPTWVVVVLFVLLVLSEGPDDREPVGRETTYWETTNAKVLT